MVLLKRGFALSRLLLLSLLLGILCSIDVAYAAEGEQYPSNHGAASWKCLPDLFPKRDSG